MVRKLLDRLRDLLDPEARSPLDRLSTPAVEALLHLIEADGDIVPADRLSHTAHRGSRSSAGEWCTPGRAASIVCELRAVLGTQAVLTVHGRGYTLGSLPEGL